MAVFNPHRSACEVIVAGSGCRSDGLNSSTETIPPFQVKWIRVLMRTKPDSDKGQIALQGLIGSQKFTETFRVQLQKDRLIFE